MRELDVEPVDFGDELGLRVDLRLDLPPVVAGAPVLDERAELCQLDALRPVVDGLLIGPARRADAPAQIGERLFRNVHPEWAARAVRRRSLVRRTEVEGRRRKECRWGKERIR